MENNQALIAQCESKAKQWLSPAFDEETRSAVNRMIANEDKTDLIESFGVRDRWSSWYHGCWF